MSLNMHQAFWVLKQLHKRLSSPEWYINFRCVQNDEPRINPETKKKEQPSRVTFDQCIQILKLKETWDKGLLAQLMQLNGVMHPSNVYYAINPLKSEGHKKEFFAQYNALFLDLDDNKSYTKAQRWMQIVYWTWIGFPPSFVIDSGHGYHVYWLLTKPISREDGEALLKRMVALSGCRQGGNTFDISRVFRLPGFRNVKEWFNNDTPPCGIVFPENWGELEDANAYEPEIFYGFPPSELKDLERYYNEAQQISGNPEEFRSNIRTIIEAARQAHATLNAQQIGEQVATEQHAEAASKAPISWEPSLTVCPPASDIKWPRGSGWMRKYCQLGHDGLNAGEIDELKIEHKFSDTSASALDFAVIHALIKKGYTREAIREFWKRPENKLYRADKEQKNANYFDMSFDKALSYVKAAAEQQEQKQKDNPVQIIEEHYMTRIKTSSSIEDLLIGQLKLNAVYYDNDAVIANEKAYYDMTGTYPDVTKEVGHSKEELFVPNSSLDSVQSLKKCFNSEGLRVVTNNNAYLGRLAAHFIAKYANVPRHIFHSKMLYKNGTFVFPNFTVTREGTQKREALPMQSALAKRFPLFDKFNVKFLPFEQTLSQLKAHWHSVLTMHTPRLICSVLGLITSSAIKPIFAEHFDSSRFHLPTINVRGASHTGKSETVRHLSSMIGINWIKGENIVGATSTEFSIIKYLSSTNFMPLLIDEFKEEGGKNAHALDTLRRIVRKSYSGESIMKGRADLSVTSITLHSALMVLGETALERPGDISEITRTVATSTDGFDPTKYSKQWTALEEIGWWELCPYLYKFILNQDPKTMYMEFKALKLEVTESLKDHFGPERLRIGHNLAALWYGCRLMDRFILSLDPKAPTIEDVCSPNEALVGQACGWAKESGQSLKTKTIIIVSDPITHQPVEKEVTEIISVNEFLMMLKTFGIMIEIKDKAVRERVESNAFVYEEREEPPRLLINLNTMYNSYTDYLLRTTKEMPPNIMKMRSLSKAAKERNQRWMVSLDKVVKTSSGTSRVMIFNLKSLREMGIWPRKALLEDNSGQNGTGQTEIAENDDENSIP